MSCSRHLMVARALLMPGRGAAPFDRSDMKRQRRREPEIDRERRSVLRLPALAVLGLFTGRTLDPPRRGRPRRD